MADDGGPVPDLIGKPNAPRLDLACDPRRREEAGAEAHSIFPAELMIWLSPAFPIGSFAYSQGLEQAVAVELVNDLASLQSWLSDTSRFGALRNDLILVSLAMRLQPKASAAPGDADLAEPPELADLADLADLAAALQPSRERYEEAIVQGEAFRQTIAAAWTIAAAGSMANDASVADAGENKSPPQRTPVAVPLALPLAVGVAAREHGLPVPATLIAYATQALGALVSAAVRLGVVGQFDGQRVLASLLDDIRSICREVEYASADDLGGSTFSADLCSLEHETLTTRLFRS